MNRVPWLLRLLDLQSLWLTVAPAPPDAETGEVLFEAAIQDTDITGYGVTAKGAMEDLAAKLMGAKTGGHR